MKRIFSILLLTLCVIAVPVSVRTVQAFGCGPAVFMGGDVDGNCVIRHYQQFCDGVVVSYDTVTCY